MAGRRITVADVKARTLTIKLPNIDSYQRVDLFNALREAEFDVTTIEALGTRKRNSIWSIILNSKEATSKFLEIGQSNVKGQRGIISGQGNNLFRFR